MTARAERGGLWRGQERKGNIRFGLRLWQWLGLLISSVNWQAMFRLS